MGIEDAMAIENTLKRAEVFLGLEDSDLSKIAALPSCCEKSYQAGEVILRAGDEARCLYVLKEGQIDLVMQVLDESGQETTRVVDRITTGDFFGWSAIAKPHFYVMSAVCKEPSRVVRINGAELMALFDEHYYIGYRVYQSLSRIIGARLRHLERLLMKGRRWPFLEDRKGR